MTPGDLVICIKQGPWTYIPNGQPQPSHIKAPLCGQVLTVRSVEGPILCLRFTEFSGRWKADRFVKLDPEATDQFDRIAQHV